jgi:hypothetical protein
MISIWEEARYQGILGCGEKRIRVRLFWIFTFTIWRWDT